MASFPVHPLAQFESSQTSIKRPRHILEYSLDEAHVVHPLSDQSLRYYYPPFFDAPWADIDGRHDIALSEGFGNWIKHNDSIDEHLDGVLKTIQAHEEMLLENGTPIEDVRVTAEVVAWRGILTKILTCQYDHFADFELNATCFQGTIYMELNHSYMQQQDQPSNRKPHRGPPQELMQYWGYKFEALSTLSKPWGECSRAEIESRNAEFVNNNVQYCSITRTGIGSTSMILAGEVDCVLNRKPEDLETQPHWVELKTNIDDLGDGRKWEMKLLKHWAQSFLLGVPTIIVGLRTPDGILTGLRTLETQKLPTQVKKMGNSWNGHVCINMTAAFLDFLKQHIMGKDGVWRVKWNKRERSIETFQVEATGTGEILDSGFKAHRERLLAAEIAQKLG